MSKLSDETIDFDLFDETVESDETSSNLNLKYKFKIEIILFQHIGRGGKRIIPLNLLKEEGKIFILGGISNVVGELVQS